MLSTDIVADVVVVVRLLAGMSSLLAQVWNEVFEFEIPDPECVLVLDLWDSDDDESVMGNLHKVSHRGRWCWSTDQQLL
jgi:hypothetical protein